MNKELDKVPAHWPEELSGVDTGGIVIECPDVQYIISCSSGKDEKNGKGRF